MTLDKPSAGLLYRRQIQLAETPAEGDKLIVAQILTTKQEHQVFQPSLMDRPENIVVDIAKIDADDLGGEGAAGRNGADTHLAHCPPPSFRNPQRSSQTSARSWPIYWLGVMFQPLTLAVVGTIRLYQRIGTVYAWVSAWRSNSRTIRARSR